MPSQESGKGSLLKVYKRRLVVFICVVRIFLSLDRHPEVLLQRKARPAHREVRSPTERMRSGKSRGSQQRKAPSPQRIRNNPSSTLQAESPQSRQLGRRRRNLRPTRQSRACGNEWSDVFSFQCSFWTHWFFVARGWVVRGPRKLFLN